MKFWHLSIFVRFPSKVKFEESCFKTLPKYEKNRPIVAQFAKGVLMISSHSPLLFSYQLGWVDLVKRVSNLAGPIKECNKLKLIFLVRKIINNFCYLMTRREWSLCWPHNLLLTTFNSRAGKPSWADPHRLASVRSGLMRLNTAQGDLKRLKILRF